mgnify:CR=1 FL=1
MITGSVVEKTFNPNDKYPTAFIDRKDMQYLYNDGDLYYFMDLESYEQLPINKSVLGDNFKFVKENMECKVLSYKATCSVWSLLSLWNSRSPRRIPLKGDTATNATKPAILETGAEIKVPLFIDEGEMIRVDTRTGEYMERA